jgi:positive regulator of sigma E activity
VRYLGVMKLFKVVLALIVLGMGFKVFKSFLKKCREKKKVDL